MIAVLGKLAWLLAAPSNLLLLLLAVGLGLAALGWRRARWLVAAAFGLLLFVTLLPVGEWLRWPLETRFAAPSPPPQQVDGILVLGGTANTRVSKAWGQPALDESWSGSPA